MPQRRSDHAAAVMGGKIYVTGGEPNLGSPVSSVYVYDPQADAWAQLASMGFARRLHASAVVGGKLYVFGGQGGVDNEDDEDNEDDDGDDERLSTAEVYDPASDSWAQGTSLTSARSLFVAAAL